MDAASGGFLRVRPGLPPRTFAATTAPSGQVASLGSCCRPSKWAVSQPEKVIDQVFPRFPRLDPTDIHFLAIECQTYRNLGTHNEPMEAELYGLHWTQCRWGNGRLLDVARCDGEQAVVACNFAFAPPFVVRGSNNNAAPEQTKPRDSVNRLAMPAAASTPLTRPTSRRVGQPSRTPTPT